MIRQVKRCLIFALSLGVSVLICNSAFASSFKKEWEAALAKPVATNDIQGAWKGVWKSNAHGVSGPLSCVIKSSGNGKYDAHFHAQFHWFHFNYVAKMQAKKTAEGYKLSGDADLGWMGGVYHYEGMASPSRYHSEYRAKSENGVLELSRPSSR